MCQRWGGRTIALTGTEAHSRKAPGCPEYGSFLGADSSSCFITSRLMAGARSAFRKAVCQLCTRVIQEQLACWRRSWRISRCEGWRPPRPPRDIDPSRPFRCARCDAAFSDPDVREASLRAHALGGRFRPRLIAKTAFGGRCRPSRMRLALGAALVSYICLAHAPMGTSMLVVSGPVTRGYPRISEPNGYRGLEHMIRRNTMAARH